MRRKPWLALGICAAILVAGTAQAAVLRVGTFDGIRGQYKTIQAAVAAAKPYDWILIGPGDYKTSSSATPSGQSGLPAGVLITKPDLRLRGMNRNAVVVDGTKPGSPRCSNSAADQNPGPSSANGALGLNGIMVWKADDVWVQNLTVCNFLGGAGGDGETGNEIWWNGGVDSASVGGWGYNGAYLTATSTFYDNETTAAEYGIFSSNWSGGTWNVAYASNFNDSGFYIGACQQICDQTLDQGWGEYDALGYSGSNSGGWMLIENSRFDNNQDGFDTNSQNGDNPPPQDGACPAGVKPPVAGAYSCWVLIHNLFDDNNNATAPSAGETAAGPVGTGMSLSGGRDDTVMDNTFENNGAWGQIMVPYPDSGPPCTGGTNVPGVSCLYDEYGDALIDNTFSHNGFFGNPTNGDFGVSNLLPDPTDCFSGNADTSGALTSAPSYAEALYPTCNGQTVPPTDTNPESALFTSEVLCDSGIAVDPYTGGAPCLPTDHYPALGTPIMHPLPGNLATMPNPCAGVPANPWCTAAKRKPAKRKPAKRKPAKRKSKPAAPKRASAPSFTG